MPSAQLSASCSSQFTSRLGGVLPALEIAERQFESAEVGMVVLIEGESDIQRVPGKQFCLLDAFGHAPTEGRISGGLSRPCV